MLRQAGGPARGRTVGAVGAREEWDRIFSGLDEAPWDAEASGCEDAWLERWLDLLEPRREAPVLDLGCGAGEDARFLQRRGFRVVAADFSEKALEIVGRRAPGAQVKKVDFARGLPFPDARFGAVVAGFSLHYFPWPKTVEILGEVHRCLLPGGNLLARLNSTNDRHYAAARKEEIGPNFYLVGGSPKRLFSRDDVAELFSDGWKVVAAEERTTSRYGSEKTLWEVVAERPKG